MTDASNSHRYFLGKALSDIMNKDSPWSDDKLGRAKFANLLCKVLATIDQPFVISLDAPYGSGKTYFASRIYQDLLNANHACIFINAWETDFADDPFTAIVSELTEQLAALRLVDAQNSKKSIAKLAGNYVLRRVIPAAVRLGTAGIIDIADVSSILNVTDIEKEAANVAAQIGEDRLRNFLDVKKSLVDFRHFLMDLTDKISKSGKFRSRTLYIFIDELDRRKPKYAIELLEIIKHLFSVNGIVFILSAHHAQLERCVANAYGLGVDQQGYLRRLIDWNYTLPDASKLEFVNFLYDRFALSEVKNLDRENVCFVLSFFATKWSFSLRTLEQCFTLLNLAYRSHAHNQYQPSGEAAFMSTLKVHDPVAYAAFVAGTISYDDIVKLIGYPHIIDDSNAVYEGSKVRRLLTYLLLWQLDGNPTIDNMGRDLVSGRHTAENIKNLTDNEKEAFTYAIDWRNAIRFKYNINGHMLLYVDQCFQLVAPMRNLNSSG
jgi:hypothetical protein